jgi:CheY-like chemotaxis protein
MNLLIIDDDAICSFINTRVAQTSGIFREILSVHNGQAALDFLQSVAEGDGKIPDVILVDLNMPIINGFDFITAFHGLQFFNKKDIGVVVLTSSAEIKDIERARALGIQHYLQKPLTVNALQATIFALKNKGSIK